MKLLEILGHLDPKALDKASLFIASPYFNKNTHYTDCFAFIVTLLKKGKSPTKEQIWLAAYPDKSYNDLGLRKLNHQLLRLVINFFASEHLYENNHLILRSVTEYCESNDIHELKNKLQKDIEATGNNKFLLKSESIHDLYTAKRYIKDIEEMFEKKRSTNKLNSFISDIDDDITIVYLIEKIRIILIKLNYLEENRLEEKNIKWQPNAFELSDFKALLSKNVLLRSLYQIYSIRILEEKIENIDEILNALEIIGLNNKYDAAEIYNHLNTHLVKQINLGHDVYDQWFILSKFGLKSKLLLLKGRIDPTNYRNIVVTACRLEEYSWALDFVEKYKTYLSPEYRQSAYSFSKARIFRSMHRYEELVEVLRNVEYEDITYNLNSRLMLIMAFYELDEYDTLDSTINAFKVFLRRQRNISQKRKANFRDFCDVVYNLVRADYKQDVGRITKANDIIANNPGIPSSWWLKEKLVAISQHLGIKEGQTLTS